MPKLTSGTYVATWRVISADGHPVQNAFTFSVGDVSQLPTGAQALANQLLSTQQAGAASSVSSTVRCGSSSSPRSASCSAGFAFLAMCWPAGRRRAATLRLLRRSWIVAFVGAIAAVLIEASYTAGLGFADSVKPSIVHDYIDTPIGHVLVLRSRRAARRRGARAPVAASSRLGAAAHSSTAVVLGLATLATFTLRRPRAQRHPDRRRDRRPTSRTSPRSRSGSVVSS